MIPVSGKENEDENEKRRKRSVDTGSYDSISGYVFYSFIFNINIK